MPLEELQLPLRKGQPFVVLLPGINDPRGRHQGSCEVGPGGGQLHSEKLLCIFCRFKGVRVWLMPSTHSRVGAEERIWSRVWNAPNV